MGKQRFVVAGPGDPELITVKGRDVIARAGAILYTGSLVFTAVMCFARAEREITDSKGMTLWQQIVLPNTLGHIEPLL